MGKQYHFSFPRGKLTANTLCVVGVCTCLLMKMAVERAFRSLGIENFDVEPATEDNPMGSRAQAPDVIFCEPLRSEEIRGRMPTSLVIEVRDIADPEGIAESVLRAFTEAGWCGG